MIQALNDSHIELIMDKLLRIKKTGIGSFQTPLLETVPGKELIRSQMFNYSVAIYGYYEEETMGGLIYYQLPAIISNQNSATIYWMNCETLTLNELKEFIEESAKMLLAEYGIEKISIHLEQLSYFIEAAITKLHKLGFKKEAVIIDGVGDGNDLSVYAMKVDHNDG